MKPDTFLQSKLFRQLERFQRKKAIIEEENPMVYCNRIEAFVDHVIDRREIEEGKVDLQFGIDDGGDVVKVYK